jgi:hypothetical protein
MHAGGRFLDNIIKVVGWLRKDIRFKRYWVIELIHEQENTS